MPNGMLSGAMQPRPFRHASAAPTSTWGRGAKAGSGMSRAGSAAMMVSGVSSTASVDRACCGSGIGEFGRNDADVAGRLRSRRQPERCCRRTAALSPLSSSSSAPPPKSAESSPPDLLDFDGLDASARARWCRSSCAPGRRRAPSRSRAAACRRSAHAASCRSGTRPPVPCGSCAASGGHCRHPYARRANRSADSSRRRRPASCRPVSRSFFRLTPGM